MLALTAASLLSACGAIGYYGQAVRGGAGVLLARRPIDKVLADPATPEALAGQLRLVQEVRRFAGERLDLGPGGAFRHYSDLGRPYAVWNVVAAPELSLEPKLWCFPIAGCVSYRGYFREEAARRYAERLASEGWDVAVQGATAYSTLGWFDDPVLSTFVHYPEPYLAGLLFHELAHAKVYLPGDTTFNESFATAVEEEGVARWLGDRGRAGDLEGYLEAQRNETLFTELVLDYRGRLERVFAEEVGEAERRSPATRQHVLRQMFF